MLADAVTRLLQKYGSALTLTRQVGTAYNPATGQTSVGTVTDFTVQAVFINYQDANVDGTVVRMGDRRLLVSPSGSTTVPAIGDMVDGLKVLDVRTYAPQGTPIAYACQMRK